MDMGTNGFYGDTFDNGFGVFETTKRRIVPSGHLEEPFAQRLRFANFSISYSPLNSDTLDTFLDLKFESSTKVKDRPTKLCHADIYYGFPIFQLGTLF